MRAQSVKRHLDVEFEVFVHCEDVVENVLGNARDDAHLVRVVQLALKWRTTVTTGRRTEKTNTNNIVKKNYDKRHTSTSMVCVFPEEVCPYAKIVPLYPHRTSGRNTAEPMKTQHVMHV